MGYRELNKVTLPIHASILNIASLMHAFSREVKTYYCFLDFTTSFLSIPIPKESPDQFAFMRRGRQGSGPFSLCCEGAVHALTNVLL